MLAPMCQSDCLSTAAIFELLFGGRLYAITGSMKNPVKLGVNRLNIVGFQFPFVAFLSRVSIRWNLN